MGNRHVENVAKNLIGKLGITPREVFFCELHCWGQTLSNKRFKVVRKEVSRMSPETLGRIAAQGLSRDDVRTEDQPMPSGIIRTGKTPLCAINHENFDNDCRSGREVLIDLATTALIAEMADVLRETFVRDSSREALTSEGM
jgi:hypothetical protein